MRLDFNDKSYVEFSYSSTGKILLTIGAKSYKNPLETIINSVEISYNEFLKLIADLNIIKTSVEGEQQGNNTMEMTSKKEVENIGENKNE